MRVGIQTGQFICERCSIHAEGAPTFTRPMTEQDSPTGRERCIACGRWSDEIDPGEMQPDSLVDRIAQAFSRAPFGFNVDWDDAYPPNHR